VARTAPAQEAEPRALLERERQSLAAMRRHAAATKEEIAAVEEQIRERQPSFGILPLPNIGYSPETELAAGGFALLYFHAGERQKTRTSQVFTDFIYTTRQQLYFDLGADLWLFRDRLHVGTTALYKYFPEFYYGVGNHTSDGARETYTSRVLSDSTFVQLRVLPHLYAGPAYAIEHREVSLDPAGGLAVDDVTAKRGAFISGAGPRVTFDSRDSVTSASRGTYADVTFMAYDSWLGSDVAFGRLQIDARHYVSLWPAHVLAFQAVAMVSYGTTPVYMLASIGSDALRGFTFGRYRDNHMGEAQMEYRFPLFWRFGGTAFVGIGEVAKRVDSFSLDGLHAAAGMGLRIAIIPSEKIPFRFDVAYAGVPAYYLKVGEAF
jgi:outer membrane protein assembly factor BamA